MLIGRDGAGDYSGIDVIDEGATVTNPPYSVFTFRYAETK